MLNSHQCDVLNLQLVHKCDVLNLQLVHKCDVLNLQLVHKCDVLNPQQYDLRNSHPRAVLCVQEVW